MGTALVSAIDYYRKFLQKDAARVTDLNVARARRGGTRRAS
jgi:hypothetical protein